MKYRLMFVIATALVGATAAAAAVAGPPAHVNVTIRHQTHHCHAWATGKGSYSGALSLAVARTDAHDHEQRRDAAPPDPEGRPDGPEVGQRIDEPPRCEILDDVLAPRRLPVRHQGGRGLHEGDPNDRRGQRAHDEGHSALTPGWSPGGPRFTRGPQTSSTRRGLIVASSPLAVILPMVEHRPPATAARRATPSRARVWSRLGGATGNSRLTAATGAILLVLLAVEGATLLSLQTFLSWHIFVGMLLVPIVLLKLAGTGYRFLRYYSHHHEYVAAGAPQIVLRLLGPIVVLSTAGLFATGVALAPSGRARPSCCRSTRRASWSGSARCRCTCSGTFARCRPSRRATSGGVRLAAGACARCSSPWRSSRGRLSPSRRCRGSNRGCTRAVRKLNCRCVPRARRAQ